MQGARTRTMSTTGESLYAVMDIPKKSTAEEIKRAYRKLALKYHPDKNPNNPEATEKFQEVNHANSILSNATKRDIYDQYGSLGLYVAHQLGEDNLSTYFLLNSACFKGLFLCCCIFTGCFCCCCCFNFCCNFCCGKCRPQMNEEDWNDIPAEEEDNPEIVTDAREPIVGQPTSIHSDFPLPVGPTPGEGTPFNTPTSTYNTAS